MFREGKIIELLLGVAIVVLVTYFIQKALSGVSREFRRLPVLDAISDGVDRGVETGKPIWMSMGAYAFLTGPNVGITISAINIMRYTFEQIIRKGAEPIFILPQNPEIQPLIDGIYREIAATEGKPEAYNADNLYYFGNEEAVYRAGVLGLAGSNPPATYVLFGAITGSGDTVAAFATRATGALMIGGQARTNVWGVLLSFDYYTYLAEVYYGGIIYSGDQVAMSSIVVGDLLTWVAVGLTLLGLIAGLIGLPLDWMTM